MHYFTQGPEQAGASHGDPQAQMRDVPYRLRELLFVAETQQPGSQFEGQKDLPHLSGNQIGLTCKAQNHYVGEREASGGETISCLARIFNLGCFRTDICPYRRH